MNEETRLHMIVTKFVQISIMRLRLTPPALMAFFDVSKRNCDTTISLAEYPILTDFAMGSCSSSDRQDEDPTITVTNVNS